MTDSNNAQTPEAAPGQVNDGVSSALTQPPQTLTPDGLGMSAAPGQVPQAPAAPNAQPKTYLERLFEMEHMINLYKSAIGELQTAYELVMSTLTEYVNEINTIQSTLGAIIDLSESGTAISRSSVEGNIKSKIADRIKDTLKKREEAGMITSIDAVTDSMNVISFSTANELFSFRLLKQLSEDIQKEAVGKKVGDKLSDMTLLGIYKINKQEAPKAPGAPETPQANN